MKDYIKKTKIFVIYKRFRIEYSNFKNSIFNSRFAFIISYYFYYLINFIQNTFLYNNKKSTIYNVDLKKLKSVIIVYSKMHFDPLNDFPDRPLYYTGTASVTRQVWNLFEGKERFFIDFKARKLDFIPKADLIIGLMSENFRICAKANPKAKKILLLVNCHPLYRAKVLLEESKSLNKHLPGTEWVSPKLFLKTRKYANSIALTGNQVIKDTYLDFGVKEIPIHILNTGIYTDRISQNLSLRPKDKIRFMYPASHKAIRKGLFRMLNAWRKLNTLVPSEKIELYLVGGDEPSFIDEVNLFIKKYPNTYNFDWVDTDTQLKYFQSSHVVVGPALEEGQVTTVLEVMACGAVPIITPQCGINLIDGVEGFIIKDYKNVDEIADYMKRLVDDHIMREKMSILAIAHVIKNNSWENFQNNFKKIVEG